MQCQDKGRESQECCDDDEKLHLKRKESMICQLKNWNFSEHQQVEGIVSSISKVNVLLPGGALSAVHTHGELDTTIGGFRTSNSIDMNFQPCEDKGPLRLRQRRGRFGSMDIARVNLKVPLVHRRKFWRTNRRLKKIMNESYEKMSTVNEETRRQLDHLTINSDSIKTDAELAMRISKLSCKHDDKKGFEELMSSQFIVNSFQQ